MRTFALTAIVALAAAGTACAAETPAAAHSPASEVPQIVDGKIGFVLSSRYWAVHESPGGKAECPNGFNDGPREQFKQLFPEDGTKRTLLDTQLMREGRQWFADMSEESFAFKEAVGNVSYGMNLDGKVGPEDFTDPDGVKGIDNQLFRAIGCISQYRAPSNLIYFFENKYLGQYDVNRFMIEISDVESLANDDDVTVRTYRGLDPLLADATGGSYIPGGTQRVDARWGKQYQQTFKGKIVGGVLVTEPQDLIIPWSATFDTNGFHKFKGLRFQVSLTPQRGEGILAGYVDVGAFYHQLNTSWSTHHQSYGQLSAPSLYRALHRLADAYPDPKTGAMTAISGAVKVTFTQVFIQHPPQQTADATDGAQKPTSQSSQ
ncbi:MAG: hypothetical protein AB7E79_07020 [Rhodospirillaceae bacterium]